MQYIPIITLVLVVILLGLVIVLLTRKPEKPELPQQIDPTASITALGTLVTQNLREGREAQSNQLSAMDKSLGDKMSGLTDQLGRFETRLQGFTAETTQNLTNIRETVDKNLHTFTGETKQDLENIRVTVDKNLRAMQEDNNKKLDDMRQIVDEKLQKTLSERMNESFKLVNERLEQVYKGLGEMQTLAQGVGAHQCQDPRHRGRDSAGCDPRGYSRARAVRDQRGDRAEQPQCSRVRGQAAR